MSETTKTSSSWWKRLFGRAKPELAALAPPKPLPDDPDDRISAVTFPLVDRWATHPGQGLTTRSIVRIFETAEAGRPADQCDLFEDIVERDAHLRSQLEARTDAVAFKEWVLTPGGDRPSDDRAARILEDALRAVPNFEEMEAHQVSHNFTGYAGSEIVWDRRDGYTVPVWFVNVPHRRFVFDEFDQPRLIVDATSFDGVELEPGKWIFSRRQARQTVRSGLLRTACWWSLFKHMAVRDWIIFAARFGIPYVTGEYAPNASPEDRKVLEKAVLSLGKDGAAVFSEACKIVVTEVTKSGSADGVHGALTEICNREISKLIAGATLTTETGGPGSYALGRVHQNRTYIHSLADAVRLARRIEADVCAPFVHFNGLPGRPPRLKIYVDLDLDAKTWAEIMSILANDLGMDLDEDQIRARFQLKPPTGKAIRGTKRATAGEPAGPKTPPAP